MTRRALNHIPGMPVPLTTAAVRLALKRAGVTTLQMGHPRVNEQQGVKLRQNGGTVSVRVSIDDPAETADMLAAVVAALLAAMAGGKAWELRVREATVSVSNTATVPPAAT